jgi:flagellar biosynthetic protein FliQ
LQHDKEAPVEPGRINQGAEVHSDLAITMMAELFWTGLLVCLPVLASTMLVGLCISVLQVVTQVQEMSLTFVPKLFTAGIALIFFGPWMLRTLAQFTTRLWTQIPSMF